MWADVWYYLGSQLITLAAAFGMSLCFESPFIRLEKLWIGALLQAIMPSKNDHVKKNGRVPEQETSKILDEIIERLDKEDEKKKQQMDKSIGKENVSNGFVPAEKEQVKEHFDREEEAEKHHENGHPHVMDDSEGVINSDHVLLEKNLDRCRHNVGDELTVAEVHIPDQSLPTYEEILDK
jgi:hypothetical protein